MTAARLPVVLLHALALDSSMWSAQDQALRERGHPVIAFDQRGFGAAPLGDAPPTLDVVADDLARVLDERRVERAVLAGSSMGGYVAMAFLRRHPDRVAGVALLSARATADTPEARAQRLRFAELVEDEATRSTTVEHTVPHLVGATTRRNRPDVVAVVRASAQGADPKALAWAQRAIAAREDATETLRATAVPAVVIAGAEDELTSPEESRHVAEVLPRGRLVTVEGAGHLTPLEAPAAVTRALCDLVEEIGATES
ncbi:pimeloyl-ACP methyl ester carboxylesterase [Saccharothrix carnea]|uniref:Pimeloyl-ACP methyl ester carboxylesterase n=1 Tax=Saccharothrix carnea TaxID=1280637 RepID=A0A2P8HR30_SACCR|nr:alpha/beta hydrolase [Saccharothrix carnea]PSL48644.1 pimeloyl-ACP methyl ester carboxylesterase [Saccharothrix carnea]